MHAVARSYHTNSKQRVRSLLKLLLDEMGLDVDAQRKGWSDGNTPLHLACERGNLVVAQVLIELGATYSLLNGWGKCMYMISKTARCAMVCYYIAQYLGMRQTVRK